MKTFAKPDKFSRNQMFHEKFHNNPVLRSNPGLLRENPSLYRFATKVGIEYKAIQVYYIPIPSDTKENLFLPLNNFCPKTELLFTGLNFNNNVAKAK